MKIGLCTGLFLLFLGLKLGGAIEWSWWLVFAPLWLPPAIFAGLVALLFFLRLRG